MKEIDSINFETEALKEGISVIDFWASWCTSCPDYMSTIESISKQITSVNFMSVKVDDNKQLARKYRVMSVPTLVIFKNGVQVNFVSGVKTESQLIDIIKKHMK